MANHPVVAIIQARMGSTRLPGKVMADVEGRPLLARVADRVQEAQTIEKLMVATTTSPEDDEIEEWCESVGIDCFRGPVEDVLHRFYLAATEAAAEVIVRITADCPLIDPEVIDRVVELHADQQADYATNTLEPTFPDGMDVEVFSYDLLKETNETASSPSEREHVTPAMRDPRAHKVLNLTSGIARGEVRLTVDSERDLDVIREIYRNLGDQKLGLEEILGFLDAHPEVSHMNNDIIRDEGFYLSMTREKPLDAQVRDLSRSDAYSERAMRTIPGGSQTFSKGPTQFVQGVAPNMLERGDGCRVWDVDGNEYLDLAMGLGPVILGHADRDVNAAVEEQLPKGTAFTLPHPLEVEVAEMLIDRIPGAEMVRFGKNGSDATTGAVRAARAFTGRDVIACCGYHGWHDWFIGTTFRNAGVPKAVQGLTETFTYNDLGSLEAIFEARTGEVAAVILEPIGIEQPEDDFLSEVKDLAHRHGALLIFDEIITGFRFARGGAQEYFGVTPDLACFGKAMANGFPISAVVGRREAMRVFEEVFFSFTFGGETTALAAAKATIQKLDREDAFSHIATQGRRLQDGFNTFAKVYGLSDHVRCVGLPPRTACLFSGTSEESLLHRSLFQQECLKRGVLFLGGHLLSLSHAQKEIDQILAVYRTAMEILADAIVTGDVLGRLEGDPVQEVFRAP